MSNSMLELARSMNTAIFRKEALYSSGKLRGRLSANEGMALDQQMSIPSFLRKKRAQGKAQFDGKTGDPS